MGMRKMLEDYRSRRDEADPRVHNLRALLESVRTAVNQSPAPLSESLREDLVKARQEWTAWHAKASSHFNRVFESQAREVFGRVGPGGWVPHMAAVFEQAASATGPIEPVSIAVQRSTMLLRSSTGNPAWLARACDPQPVVQSLVQPSQVRSPRFS